MSNTPEATDRNQQPSEDDDLTAFALLGRLHRLGLTVRTAGGAVEIAGDMGRLDDGLRQAIRDHKAELLELLGEAEAVAWADTPEADEPLADLMEWFESLEDPDTVLARCRHHAHPKASCWLWRGERLVCRWCGRLWRNDSAPPEGTSTMAKSPGAATPGLF